MIEVLQRCVVERLQALEVADKVALLVNRTLEQVAQHIVLSTELGAITCAKLLLDNTALRVNLGGLKSDKLRPVV